MRCISRPIVLAIVEECGPIKFDASWAPLAVVYNAMATTERKLPQSRHYLRAARWGIAEVMKLKPVDEAFMFFIVGILASLRAV